MVKAIRATKPGGLDVMSWDDVEVGAPDKGEVLVTGAAGGVGSVATAILAHLGYQVVCVTGRAEAADYLTSLGASRIIGREDLSTLSKAPLESETWAGCIDAVGGHMLARVLGQMKYGSSVASVGLAGGEDALRKISYHIPLMSRPD